VIILGIDPGTANTGYGVVEGDGLGLVSLVECGVIRT
jgi:crossover junction endodeoxyribonuclease RuvC